MVNKNTYNPKLKKLNRLKGIIDAPKGFDPVKVVKESNFERF